LLITLQFHLPFIILFDMSVSRCNLSGTNKIIKILILVNVLTTAVASGLGCYRMNFIPNLHKQWLVSINKESPCQLTLEHWQPKFLHAKFYHNLYIYCWKYLSDLNTKHHLGGIFGIWTQLALYIIIIHKFKLFQNWETWILFPFFLFYLQV